MQLNTKFWFDYILTTNLQAIFNNTQLNLRSFEILVVRKTFKPVRKNDFEDLKLITNKTFLNNNEVKQQLK